MTKIIGIGGCSRSGKSRLALRLKDQTTEKVLALDMDDFVFPEAEIPKIKDRTDWERPESVDFPRLCREVEQQKDNYDIVVVEGILIFANEQLRSIFNTTVWMRISKETFEARRKMETRWGHEPAWFIAHVWESHLRFGQFRTADFVIPGEEKVTGDIVAKVLAK